MFPVPDRSAGNYLSRIDPWTLLLTCLSGLTAQWREGTSLMRGGVGLGRVSRAAGAGQQQHRGAWCTGRCAAEPPGHGRRAGHQTKVEASGVPPCTRRSIQLSIARRRWRRRPAALVPVGSRTWRHLPIGVHECVRALSFYRIRYGRAARTPRKP